MTRSSPTSEARAGPTRRFAALLGSRHPILLAPMAGAGGVELAVGGDRGRRGGIAALRDARRPTRCARRSGEVRARAAGPLNLNFFCHRMPADAGRRRLARPARALLRALRPRRRSRRPGPLRLPVRPGHVRGGRGGCGRSWSASISAFPIRTCSTGSRDAGAKCRQRHHGRRGALAGRARSRRASSPRAGRRAAMPAASSAAGRTSRWACSRCCRRSPTPSACPSSPPAGSPTAAGSRPPSCSAPPRSRSARPISIARRA